jgi:hypothetical protein
VYFKDSIKTLQVPPRTTFAELESILKPHTTDMWKYFIVDKTDVWQRITPNSSLPSSLLVIPLKAPTADQSFPDIEETNLNQYLNFPKEKLLHFLRTEAGREDFIRTASKYLKIFNTSDMFVPEKLMKLMSTLQWLMRTSKEMHYNELAVMTVSAVDHAYPSHPGLQIASKKLLRGLTSSCTAPIF